MRFARVLAAGDTVVLLHVKPWHEPVCFRRPF